MSRRHLNCCIFTLFPKNTITVMEQSTVCHQRTLEWRCPHSSDWAAFGAPNSASLEPFDLRIWQIILNDSKWSSILGQRFLQVVASSYFKLQYTIICLVIKHTIILPNIHCFSPPHSPLAARQCSRCPALDLANMQIIWGVGIVVPWCAKVYFIQEWWPLCAEWCAKWCQ